MRYYICPKCHANVDAGEMIGGICEDCYLEEQKRLARHESMKSLLNPDMVATQMEMSDFMQGV